MVELIKPNEWKRFLWAAAACLIVYVFIEIVPMFGAIQEGEYSKPAITKAEAGELASSFAAEQTGLAIKKAKAVHQSDKLLNGYLSKEELLPSYNEQYDASFPTDTYQVELAFQAGGRGFVYVHMESGEIVAWNLFIGDEELSDTEKNELIQSFLLAKNFRAGELTDGKLVENGEWIGKPTGFSIGEAKLGLELAALSVDGKPVITKYKPAFIAPADYRSYVKNQDAIAGFLTGFGYMFMSFVLFVLAVIYAVLYRRFTSFKYGIWLTIIFFITYIIMNLNILDGIRASLGENPGSDQMVMFTAIFTVFLTIPMAASVYISIVAGDGLWKAQGRSVWPRFGQRGYGQYVWRSMGLSYMFAVILFAVQAIIFLVLHFTIGTWGTSDVTQSPYNMGVLWLMPVLAWAAAISEEAVFRFFGIGLFRRWFKNTFAAALLPTLFWALGHVMYPFYPATTRLFELMIIGLLFSFIFVRYGFITAMFTHAIFNSVAVGMSLLTVGSAANIISAIFFSDKKEKEPPATPTVPHLEKL
jgi:membrane protease YdiL (CAAX protease family)